MNFQPIGDYQTAGSYELSQDVLRYLTISSAILNYQPIGNYQATGSYLLSQEVLQYLTISSAILNYQPITNANTNNTYFYNSITTLSSSIYNLNSVNINNFMTTTNNFESYIYSNNW